MGMYLLDGWRHFFFVFVLVCHTWTDFRITDIYGDSSLLLWNAKGKYATNLSMLRLIFYSRVVVHNYGGHTVSCRFLG